MKGAWRAASVALLATCPCAATAQAAQSALRPAGPPAARIAGLWWLLFAVATAVFLVTMGLLAVGMLRREPDDPERRRRGAAFVVVSGIAVPAVILFSVLFLSLGTTVALKLPASGDTLTVHITGHQWWWEVNYPRYGIATANEITIPAGRPVRLDLDSADVVHSFWAPSLNGKMDLIPGKPNVFWIAADRPGRYRGQCAEYCGLQHAHMAFFVVALPPADFDRWLAQMQQPHAPPANRAQLRGREVFAAAGCKDCHTIAGTGAVGRKGPDLTHVASRLTLGAGTVANTPGALEGWIADPQGAKPGIKMPRSYIPPADLHALRDYLETLR